MIPGPPSVDASSSRRTVVESDHCDEPLSPGESGRIWQPKGMADVELLHGRYRRYTFARHFHTVAAIGVVDAGVMRTYCQGVMHRVPAGTVILFNPGDVHAPQPACAAGWSFRMFYLDDALLLDLSGHLDRSRPLWFVKPFVEDPALYSALWKLHRDFENDPDPLESESRLVSGLAQVDRHSLSPMKPESSDVDRANLERAREYMHAHSAESVTLRQLATVAELSPYHFLRSFRAQVGITPHAYLMQARIERGRMLLRSGISIVDAALQTGFADQSHFTRQFKRFTGITPGRYLPAHSQPPNH